MRFRGWLRPLKVTRQDSPWNTLICVGKSNKFRSFSLLTLLHMCFYLLCLRSWSCITVIHAPLAHSAKALGKNLCLWLWNISGPLIPTNKQTNIHTALLDSTAFFLELDMKTIYSLIKKTLQSSSNLKIDAVLVNKMSFYRADADYR